jgi:hypothetical protein
MSTTPPADTPPDPAAPAQAGADAPAEGSPDAPAPTPRRRWLRRRPAPAGEAAAGEAARRPATEDGHDPASAAEAAEGADATADGATGRVAGPRRLRRDRRRLISRREEVVYHLGGLAFELYRRDMLHEEVMRRRAGEVAEIDDTVRDIDVRLGEIDRERRERRQRAPADPSAGCCLTCRSPFRADARFCWQCGAQLVPPSVGDEQPTAVIAMRADGS